MPQSLLRPSHDSFFQPSGELGYAARYLSAGLLAAIPGLEKLVRDREGGKNRRLVSLE